MNESYSNERTTNVMPFVNYTQDFTDPGDFQVEDFDDETCLMCTLESGLYKDGKWKYASEKNAYDIVIQYKNKSNVELALHAVGNFPEAIETYKFIKEIAKKHFFVNSQIMDTAENLDDEVNDKVANDIPLLWEDIEAGINALQTVNYLQFTAGNSWRKTMTIEELREVFNDMKFTSFKFPEYHNELFEKTKALKLSLPYDISMSKMVRNFLLNDRKEFEFISGEISGDKIHTFQGLLPGATYKIIVIKNTNPVTRNDVSAYIQKKEGLKPGIRGLILTWLNFKNEIEPCEYVFLSKATDSVYILKDTQAGPTKKWRLDMVEKNDDFSSNTNFVYFKEI